MTKPRLTSQPSAEASVSEVNFEALPGIIDRLKQSHGPIAPDVVALAERLLRFRPVQEHDALVMLSVELAFVAAEQGNPAIGALLVDATGNIVETAGPRNLVPYFRSDLHAEMYLIDKFEERHQFENQAQVFEHMQGMTLVTSLEPCAMCMPRLILSGVPTVLHAADEVGGGMVHLQENLPEVWRQLIKDGNKQFAQADCSDELRQIAWEIFLLTITASGRTDIWPDADAK